MIWEKFPLDRGFLTSVGRFPPLDRMDQLRGGNSIRTVRTLAPTCRCPLGVAPGEPVLLHVPWV